MLVLLVLSPSPTSSPKDKFSAEGNARISSSLSPFSIFHFLHPQLLPPLKQQSFDTPLYRFNVPTLRVDTLYSLLTLADELLRANALWKV
ncbi:hypothetical protein BVRB_4g083300 [Beta vulgaris subsp. vulgaris]|nr:hypothetical protein BVRB_4g083300 [Beta vulgaris subsp. vulgaris]